MARIQGRHIGEQGIVGLFCSSRSDVAIVVISTRESLRRVESSGEANVAESPNCTEFAREQ